jgi:hypothetical protein
LVEWALVGPVLVAEDIAVEVAFRAERAVVTDMTLRAIDWPIERGRIPVPTDHVAHNAGVRGPDVLLTGLGCSTQDGSTERADVGDFQQVQGSSFR